MAIQYCEGDDNVAKQVSVYFNVLCIKMKGIYTKRTFI